MIITSVKFFQPVEVPTTTGKTPAHHVTNKDHTITLEGQFIKIEHNYTKAYVKATIYNLCYLREEPGAEATNTTPTTRPQKLGSAQKKDNPLV